jgi:hypothetical protein
MKAYKYLMAFLAVSVLMGFVASQNATNTCSNLGNIQPNNSLACTSVQYSDGSCCYVNNKAKNISYCVYLKGTVHNESLALFKYEFKNETINVECGAKRLFLSVILMFAILVFM